MGEGLKVALAILAMLIFCTGILAAIIVVPEFYWFMPSEKNITVTVKEKWVKQQDKTAYYLFSDMNGNVYKLDDDFWYGKWNSSDQYAMIHEGKTYNMKTCGWRTHWLSEYPNVINIYQ